MSITQQCEVKVPDIGESKDIPVIEVHVKTGDLVHLDQAVVTLESDKATLDVPAVRTGRVHSVAVSVGSRVSAGSLILTLEVDDVGVAESNAPATTEIKIEPRDVPVANAKPSATAVNPAPEPSLPPQSAISSRIYGSPSVRRLARQLGADLTQVTGSGRGGRILAEDLHESVKQQIVAPSPALVKNTPSVRIDHSKYGEIERKPISRIRRISGSQLAHNWVTIPHVTNFEEADISGLDEFRVSLNKEFEGNPRVTLLAFLVKAVVSTLRQFGDLNASLEGSDLVVKNYYNIGVAVDTPGGLVVPVLRGVDRLGILAIAHQLAEKSASARAGKLKPDDFEGGTFTISSLGSVGGTGFTPIINAPEIAILGVARASIQPRYEGGQFLPRLILPLSLSWDHRATDGVAAARFLVLLSSTLHDPRRMLLA